jgi:hypothetical protein
MKMKPEITRQNGVKLEVTYAGNGNKLVYLQSKTRRVSMEQNKSGLWAIYLEDLTRENSQGLAWLLSAHNDVDTDFAMSYLDTWQYKTGFFQK